MNFSLHPKVGSLLMPYLNSSILNLHLPSHMSFLYLKDQELGACSASMSSYLLQAISDGLMPNRPHAQPGGSPGNRGTVKAVVNHAWREKFRLERRKGQGRMNSPKPVGFRSQLPGVQAPCPPWCPENAHFSKRKLPPWHQTPGRLPSFGAWS